jgi:hypothetical protein
MLPLFFAQLPDPTSPQATAWLIIAGIFGVGGLVLIVLNIAVNWKQLRSSSEVPNPLTVRAATDYATKGELATLETRISGEMHQLHGRISGLRTDMGERMDRLEESIAGELREQRKDTKAEISGVHERVNDVLKAVSELKGRIDA